METICISVSDEEKMGTYERGIVKRIVGPKKSLDGEYRMWKIWGVEGFLDRENIVRFIKA